MRPSQFFHHCPRCGAKHNPPAENVFECSACGFKFFFNPSIATAAFIERQDGRLLFIRRAKDPAKGTLSPPGGFVDIGETAEAAVRREVREEVGLEITDVEFVCSAPNNYHYREITYNVLDLFFVAHAVAAEQAVALDDVDSFCWLHPHEVDPGELAFVSMRAAWPKLLAHYRT